MTDHDQFLKKLFIHHFADLLELVVPRLAPHLRAEDATFLMQETFSAVVEEGDRAMVDLVAKTPTVDGDHELILIHVEVEGEYRTTMPERMWRY